MLSVYMPSEECQILTRYRAEFPNMWDRFQGFLYLDPDIRPRQALRFLKTLLRHEWLAHGVSEAEIDTLFAFKRRMLNFDRAHRPDSLNFVKTKLRIWVYDTPTVILGQNRADEAIPPDDYLVLQKIASSMIFASNHFQDNLEAMLSIIDEDNSEARWVKDIE